MKRKRSLINSCTFENCDLEHHGNGYCSKHNAAFKRGTIQATKFAIPVHVLFVCKEFNCRGAASSGGFCEYHYIRSNEYRVRRNKRNLENRESVNERVRLSYLRNATKRRSYRKEYVLNNKDKVNALVTKKNHAKRKATPPWADKESIRMFYKNRPKGMHVDHIIPIQSEVVCGLHVHWNLQYLTPVENIKKGNKIV